MVRVRRFQVFYQRPAVRVFRACFWLYVERVRRWLGLILHVLLGPGLVVFYPSCVCIVRLALVKLKCAAGDRPSRRRGGSGTRTGRRELEGLITITSAVHTCTHACDSNSIPGFMSSRSRSRDCVFDTIVQLISSSNSSRADLIYIDLKLAHAAI